MADTNPARLPRDKVVAQFRQTIGESGGFLVGAAVGAGITAQAAELGGADFLVALTAGRMRMMGVPSISCMLPVCASNELIDSFAQIEVLARSSCPVFLGVSVMDSGDNLANRIGQVKRAGFPGVTNWPTCNLYPQGMQRMMDAGDIGFARELQMLELAREAGLTTLAMVCNARQAGLAAKTGVDLICLNLGWNSGGSKGLDSSLTVEEVALQVREVQACIRRTDKQSLLLVEGGPLETPAQLAVVCRDATVHGYIGGSTLERLPVEDSVTMQTASFKKTMLDLARATEQSAGLRQWASQHGLIGDSAAWLVCVEQLQQQAAQNGPVVLVGEAGTPIVAAARALHRAGRASQRDFVALSAGGLTTSQLERRLFDTELAGEYRGLADPEVGTVLIDQIELTPMRLQAKLARYLREGTFAQFGSRRFVAGTARILFGVQRSVDTLARAGKLHPELARTLSGAQVRMPPLVERSEDVGALFDAFATEVAPEAAPRLSPVALRRLMQTSWPNNDAQLRELTEKIVEAASAPVISAGEVTQLLSPDGNRVHKGLASERDLILDALWRNNFHRAKTAQALGMSRKTLYNKMRRYKLSGGALD